MADYSYDANHIRYELVSSNENKPYNWLFIPGGPGADSRYFHSLLSLLELPGNVWLIDLPGNGDNQEDIPVDYNFDSWFSLFLPMVQKFKNAIIVGHSFGGMLPLLFPKLEDQLIGFIILNSAPSLWLADAVAYAKQFDLPDLTQDMQAFTQNPSDSTFKAALDACLPYYFPAKTLEKGRDLIKDVPIAYLPAVWWQRKAVEINFSSKWIPENVPTMILSGPHDCICPYYLFPNDPRFKRSNIEIINIPEAGHFPWIDNPSAVQATFKSFCEKLDVASIKN